MQTNFTLAQLADPQTASSEAVIRACVHCGFCTATCPTYVLTGDERDSPRGRIYLIKEMLEQGVDAGPVEARHIDRCLSCLSCMTTCPSGVHYMHLVDHARAHIAATYARPWNERALRRLLAMVLPHPRRFRLALAGAILARPFQGLLPRGLRALIALAPRARAALAGRPAAGLQGLGQAAVAGGAACRLRAAGARSGDQCRDGAPPDETRLRGGGGARRALLRRPGASPRP